MNRKMENPINDPNFKVAHDRIIDDLDHILKCGCYDYDRCKQIIESTKKLIEFLMNRIQEQNKNNEINIEPD